MQQTLNQTTQLALRQANVITENEVAIQFGDKYVAQNIITNDRREITVPANLIESTNNRRVLKG